jgi:hypothetical protein
VTYTSAADVQLRKQKFDVEPGFIELHTRTRPITGFIQIFMLSVISKSQFLKGGILKNAKHCSKYRDSQSEFTISMNLSVKMGKKKWTLTYFEVFAINSQL